MWSDLSIEWRKCFELAWKAFVKESTPVGAIIKDADNNIIVQRENGTGNLFHKKISHAELNALSDIAKMKNIDDLVIYTSLEPCVMCFSAIYVQKIKKIYYATKDPHAGGTFLYKINPYFSLRKMDIIQFKNDEYSFVNAVLIILHELRSRETEDLEDYLSDWKKEPLLINVANKLFVNYGIEYLLRKVDCEEVYNFIASYKYIL